MKTKNLKKLWLLSLIAIMVFQIDAFAQKKKYKDAPDETIILMIGEKNPTYDESQFPHLKLYYLNDLNRDVTEGDVHVGIGKKNEVVTYSGEPQFLALWGMKAQLVGNDYSRGIVVDKAGTTSYQAAFRWVFENYNNDKELLDRTGNKSSNKPLKDYLADQITKGKTVKIDTKKSYQPGIEPSFKSWEDGDIVGMTFPSDFTVHTPDGAILNFKEIINDKPSLIFFYQIDKSRDYNAADKLKSEEEISKMDKKTAFKTFLTAAKNSGDDLLWELERVLYNYQKPRK